MPRPPRGCNGLRENRGPAEFGACVKPRPGVRHRQSAPGKSHRAGIEDGLSLRRPAGHTPEDDPPPTLSSGDKNPPRVTGRGEKCRFDDLRRRRCPLRGRCRPGDGDPGRLPFPGSDCSSVRPPGGGRTAVQRVGRSDSLGPVARREGRQHNAPSRTAPPKAPADYVSPARWCAVPREPSSSALRAREVPFGLATTRLAHGDLPPKSRPSPPFHHPIASRPLPAKAAQQS